MTGLGRGLDSYVRRIFLGALVACLIIFIGLWIMTDFFSRVDEILEKIHDTAEPQTTASVAWLMIRYILVTTPFFLHVTAPFLCLIAALYTVNRLLRANELIPMVTAGVSLYRTLRPIFVCTAGFALLVFVNQELLLPPLALDQMHLHRQLKGRSTRLLSSLPIFSDRAGNRYIINFYDPHPEHRQINGLVMVKTEEQAGGNLALTRQVVASTARWVESTATHSRGWILGPRSTEITRDARGVIRQQPIEFLGTENGSLLKPQLIEHADLDKPALSIRELTILNHRQKNPALVLEIHRHFTHPLKCLMLLFLGLPFLMRAYSRQLTVGPILKCLVVSVAFMLFDLLCLDLGNRTTLSPVMAAWLPFVVFSAVAAVLLDRVRT